MANVKFIAVSRGLKGILEYVTNREKTIDSLISGVNCVGETALDEFEAVKKQFRKTDGRGYYHIVQSFSPDDPLDFDTAHEIGVKFAEYFKGYQCVVATHMNTEHIHNHIIMNSVNYETGQKYHQSARDMQMAKEFSNQLCLQYGLSITETKADRNRIPAWKKKLRDDIRKAMAQSYDTLDFVWYMESWGYKVKWEVGEKYITYTTPENIKCRDKNYLMTLYSGRIWNTTSRWVAAGTWRSGGRMNRTCLWTMRFKVWPLSSRRSPMETRLDSIWRRSTTVRMRSTCYSDAERKLRRYSMPCPMRMKRKSTSVTTDSTSV